ncbi:uncharacterized protein LOC113086830 [Carassius auratus]|uniref:Uncharacterized protein LOC113086830 n=1 Tax=Carassius auratus TaxID=7957 RepID=A0A6P6NQW8_CARAU|nr:uncharacterized protein LOC113086830 [Carassius auratus]
MMGRYMLILFAFLVEGVFGAEVKSVKEGDPVILHSGVIKEPDDMMLWYFNNTRIALFNGDPKETCLYDGPDGRFKDRLMLDVKTASLIITNSRPEHTGRYEAEFKKGDNTTKLDREKLECKNTTIITKKGNLDKTIKSFSLTVSGSGLSSCEVAVIVGVVLLLVVGVGVGVVGVIYLHCRSPRNDEKKNKQVPENKSFFPNGKV